MAILLFSFLSIRLYLNINLPMRFSCHMAHLYEQSPHIIQSIEDLIIEMWSICFVRITATFEQKSDRNISFLSNTCAIRIWNIYHFISISNFFVVTKSSEYIWSKRKLDTQKLSSLPRYNDKRKKNTFDLNNKDSLISFHYKHMNVCHSSSWD